MPQHRKAVFDVVRSWLDSRGFTPDRISVLDRALADAGVPADDVSSAASAPSLPSGVAGDPLTPKVAMEIVTHEAIVQEAYLDGGGVWTWGVGITNASGHQVFPHYKDSPQPISHCLAVYIWLLRARYLPAVLAAFGGHALTEAQLAAALSFHWNTGAIGKTEWVELVKAGRQAEARAFLESHYLNDGALVGRRKAEAALFFDGHWAQDGKAMIYPVAKPSYHPDFRSGHRVDIMGDLAAAVAGGAA